MTSVRCQCLRSQRGRDGELNRRWRWSERGEVRARRQHLGLAEDVTSPFVVHKRDKKIIKSTDWGST